MKTKTILLTLTTLFAAAESGDAQTAPNDKKVLVAYFSHSGNTRAVAERIAAATGADLFEIVPQKPYPAEYRAVVDQARREIAADYRPALKTDLPDAGRYDVIYIGSPCWWSTVAPPVATFLARFSLLRPAIDTEKCVGCNRCARNCKASCIDVEHHRIDYSRCVVCMDCIDTCHKNAIAYELRPKTRKPAKEEKRESGREENPAGLSRRSFLSLTGVFAAHTALRAQEKLTDGGLAVIEQKKIPRRATPIVPAGAASLRNMAHHCTGCQLCVAVCPNGVLRPSEKLTSLMQPEMSYERGYCRPECTKCSEVCPAGAILPVTAAEKSSVQIGHAVWIRANCVPLTDGVDCGNCARHCPSEAITMVPSDTADPDSPKIPVVNTERCIGCGACENLCPARPFSTIYVEGHERHRTI